MKQSLQLKLGQQLTMTPQLQQAIRLLQLSTLDLQQEIQQALDSNPMLELNEELPEEPDRAEEPNGNSDDSPLEGLEDSVDWSDDTSHDAADGALPDELPVDTRWEDLLPSGSAPPPPVNDEQPDSDFEARNTPRESLRDQLLWQLNQARRAST